jgi:hypothetical protein
MKWNFLYKITAASRTPDWGATPSDPRSLCPLSSTEFVEPPPPEKNSWVLHCTHPYPNVLTAITFNDESSGLADRIHKGLEENAREGRKAEASNAAIATTHVTLHIAVVCNLKWRDKGLLPPERCPSVCQRRGPQPRRETQRKCNCSYSVTCLLLSPAMRSNAGMATQTEGRRHARNERRRP